MPTKQNVMPVAGLLSGALVWGLIWYPYRVLQDAGVGGPLATLLTYVFAMLWGSFMLPRVWRERSRFGGWMVLLVVSSGWANLGYVLGMLHGEVMRVLLLFYLAPLWTILFSSWLLGERLNRYGVLVIMLSMGGALIMLWRPEMGLPLPGSFSEWLGLSAGMAFAFSNVVSRRASHLSVETKSFGMWLGTAVFALPIQFWIGEGGASLFNLPAQFWTMLVLMGLVICTTAFAVQFGVSHLAANRAVVLFLFELVVAAITSYILAGEVMLLRDWIGATLIVSASLLSGKMHSPEPS